jgi:hypothetical protein
MGRRIVGDWEILAGIGLGEALEEAEKAGAGVARRALADHAP